MFGYSAGADIATHWLVQHGNDPSAPSPNDLSFVLIGNSDHPDGGVFPTLFGPASATPTYTKYKVTEIARQYDGWADWP